jgi:hypothetical protein
MNESFSNTFVSEHKKQKESAFNQTIVEEKQKKEYEEYLRNLNANIENEFTCIVKEMQRLAFEINEHLEPAEKVRIETPSFHVIASYSNFEILFKFKFLASKGEGTDPCVEIHFGQQGTGVGNGTPSCTLFPMLNLDKLAWTTSRNRQSVYTSVRIAESALKSLQEKRLLIR